MPLIAPGIRLQRYHGSGQVMVSENTVTNNSTAYGHKLKNFRGKSYDNGKNFDTANVRYERV